MKAKKHTLQSQRKTYVFLALVLCLLKLFKNLSSACIHCETLVLLPSVNGFLGCEHLICLLFLFESFWLL